MAIKNESMNSGFYKNPGIVSPGTGDVGERPGRQAKVTLNSGVLDPGVKGGQASHPEVNVAAAVRKDATDSSQQNTMFINK